MFGGEFGKGENKVENNRLQELCLCVRIRRKTREKRGKYKIQKRKKRFIMPHPMTQDEKYKMMTEAPIPPLIGKLAVPTIVSMLITSIYNMADTFFVGRI